MRTLENFSLQNYFLKLVCEIVERIIVEIAVQMMYGTRPAHRWPVGHPFTLVIAVYILVCLVIYIGPYRKACRDSEQPRAPVINVN